MKRAMNWMHVTQWILMLALVAPATGLGSQDGGPFGDDNLHEAIRQRGLDPETVLAPLALSDEMRAWARSRVPSGLSKSDRIIRLLEAILLEDGLDLDYQAGFTGTAAEVFEARSGNCLGFTQLFVAMGRDLGVDVYYLAVNQLTNYRRESDLIIVSDHVTAAFDEGARRRVLEFALGPQFDYRAAREVDDLAALGLYYSNRGAELVQEQRHREAVEQLEIALKLAPDLAQAWVNLGVARRRLGDFAGAEAEYRRAIETDPDQLSAYHNLVGLYLLLDRKDPVGEILEILDRRSNRNPFVYLLLGDLSLERRRLEDARRFYRRAVRLGRGHAETHAAFGHWHLEAGDREQAARSLERAEKRDSEEERTVALRQRLSPEETPPSS